MRQLSFELMVQILEIGFTLCKLQHLIVYLDSSV